MNLNFLKKDLQLSEKYGIIPKLEIHTFPICQKLPGKLLHAGSLAEMTEMEEN